MNRIISREIMEQILGRRLLSTEDVHHINGNHKDNRIENLQVMTHSEHIRLHSTGRGVGRIVSKETRERLSKSHLGKKHSPELTAKIAAANRGHHRSKESLINMSLGQQRRRHPELFEDISL